MGLEASIDISYYEEIELNIFIESLLEYGWSVNDYGKITYLVNDDYDWESTDLSNKQLVLNLVINRFRKNKITGIALTNINLVGGIFLFGLEKNNVTILPNINRVKIIGTEFTDYTFYIQKLFPILKNCSMIKYSDIS